MLLDHFVPVPIGVSLLVVGVILTVAIAASLVKLRRDRKKAERQGGA
jgi:hypothetical protein